MMANQSSHKHLLKVHIAGGLVCALIAGGSIYFAGNEISKRRGIYLNARHELASTKSLLNDSNIKKSALASRVRTLEMQAVDQIKLISVRQLNARTSEIVRLAESVGIRIDSLQPEERVTDKRVPVQPMRFIGSSDANKVILFLGLMSDHMPDIHIQTVDLHSDSMESASVEIDILMYWFIDPADAE